MSRGENHGVNFVFEFYDEDATFPPFLEKVVDLGFQYAYILHDLDVFIDGDKAGELKKAHFHVIVHTQNDRSLSAVCSLLDVPERFAQVLKKGDELSDTKSFLRYMIHADKASIASDKHRYDLDSLIGPLADKYRSSLLSRKSRETPADILLILDFISASDSYVSMDSLIRFSVEHGLYSLLRRSASLIRSVLDDHNTGLRMKLIQDSFSADVIEFRRIKDAYNFTKNRVAAAGGNPDCVKVNMKMFRDLLDSKDA